MSTPNPYLALVKVLVLLAVIGLLIWAGYTINGWRVAAGVNGASVEQLNRTGEATTNIAKDVSAAVQDNAVKEDAVTTTRIEHVHKYEALKNENKDVRDYVTRPVPEQLRELAKARRESRERLGSSKSGDSTTGKEPDTPR